VGEFRSDLDATKISYFIKLSTPKPAEVPNTTWLVGDRGFLMFADLVPLDLERVLATFVLPAGWSVESSITPDASGWYEVSNPQKSVFFVGRSLRKASKSVDGMMLEFVIDGKWRFKDEDVLKAASTLMQKYLALTGFRLPGKSAIMIAPAPASLGKSAWKAETRGSSVVVVLDPNHSDWFGQVRALLIHEMLHLWVPNSLNLEGDYDWFFEGFTLYMAVRTAVELKITDFNGFLFALSGVYDSYSAQPDPLSLIEESERRWASSSSHVYYKGLLVAFLYDLLLRKESSGRITLAARYRDLFNGAVAAGGDGNEAIIRLLGVSPATRDFTKSFIESSGALKLEQLVSVYGLQLERSGKKSKLKVRSNLDPDQEQLLRSLGYRS
jgi:predicted metalloprotease with PDZ domain